MAIEDFLNTDAEEMDLIGAILSSTNRHRLDLWLYELDGQDFGSPIDGDIWAAARTLHSTGKRVSMRSILTVKDTPQIHERLKKRQGVMSPAEEVPDKIRAVKDVAAKRRLCIQLREVIEMGVTDTPYSEVLEAAHSKLSSASADEEDSTVHDMTSALTLWQERMDAPPESVRIFPTPWDELNMLLNGGLQPGRLYTVAARPGFGKTVVGVNIAQNAAKAGFPAMVFSLEMSTFEVTSRIVASGAEAELGRIMGHNLDDWAKRKIDTYMETASDIPLYIVDKADVTVEWIASQARARKRMTGLDVIVVDYLQLVRPVDTRIPREQQVAGMARALKLLARELDVAVILAAQINRLSVAEKRPPEASDLRESGAIEQDSDGIIMIDPVMDAGGNNTGEVDFYIRKNRQGRQGSIRLASRLNYARFDTMPRNNNFQEY